MASTLHTETFLVTVTYGGKRKKFEDLFSTRNTKTVETEINSHKVEKIATKSMRSEDEQTIREVIRQAVTKAGYVVGNVSKAKLGDTDARVDYAAKSGRAHWDNKILQENGCKQADTTGFSIYLPHIYVNARFDEPNLKLLAGWYHNETYHKPKDRRSVVHAKSIFKARRSQVKYSNGRAVKDENNNIVYEMVWADDPYRKTFVGRDTICLSDPNVIDLLAEYLTNLNPRSVGEFLSKVEAEAQLDMERQLAEEKAAS